MVVKPWTQEELDYLKENFSKYNKEHLAEHLPGRTVNAIGIKASKLGITFKRQWTEQEKIYLEREYLKGTDIKTLCEHLGRSKEAVIFQANQRLWITRKGDKE